MNNAQTEDDDMGKSEEGNGIKMALLQADIDEHINSRLENLRAKQSPLSAFFTWCGGISGIISVAAILIFGGRVLQRIDGHDDSLSRLDVRVSAVEGTGSRGLATHVAEDDARITALRERMAAMEKVVDAIPRLESGMIKNTVLLEQVSKQVERLETIKPKPTSDYWHPGVMMTNALGHVYSITPNTHSL